MKTISLEPRTILDFPESGIHLIEASAGTGKTYTISNLYLKYICQGQETRNLLVVTFTKAATDELRGRVRKRLYEALDVIKNDSPTNDDFLLLIKQHYQQENKLDLIIDRLRLAVRSMDEAAIYTIHGFCQKTLSEFAFESRQQFQQSIVTNDDEWWEQAIQDWWRNTVYPLNMTELQLFLSTVNNIDDFKKLLKPLLSPEEKTILPQPVTWDDLRKKIEFIKADVLELSKKWTEIGTEIHEVLIGSPGLSRTKTNYYKKDKLTLLFESLAEYFLSNTGLSTIQLPEPEFELLTRSYIEANRVKKPDENLAHPFFDECDQVWLLISKLKLDIRVWAISNAETCTKEKVWKLKQQSQALSFNDLLTTLNEAIQQSTSLGKLIQHRYPIALIDEFQDTDPVQYSIFEQIYRNNPDSSLILIGDPKQAIYSFRGGDIFTYMKAKQAISGESIYTLNTNWRSSSSVIKAINTLFEYRQEQAFVYNSIPYLKLYPAPNEIKPDVDLVRSSTSQAALTLWSIPLTESKTGKPAVMAKEAVEHCIHVAVAAEVASLIAEGQAGTAMLGDKPVKAGDIAILVRNAYQARDLRRILQKHNINAVSIDKNNVFTTDEAHDLQLLLRAVLEPQNKNLARQAITSGILNLSLTDIDNVINNELNWLDWLEQLAVLHDRWQRKGFMAMFQSLLQLIGKYETLNNNVHTCEPASGMQRQFTNILHLGELLQQASKSHPGIESLYSWYQKQTEGGQNDESLLRLESDDELVQIVTVHSSKGLEYPVVFVPYLWSCKPRDKKGLLSFHNDTDSVVDAGSEDIDRHLCIAEKERLAEDIRLAYVALTRAKSALYLAWGNAGAREGKSSHTALAYLLHPNQSVSLLTTELPLAFDNKYDLDSDLVKLTAQSAGTIVKKTLPEPGDENLLLVTEETQSLKVKEVKIDIARNWRISSFSALTRNIHTSGIARDKETVENHPAFQFPAGSDVGTFIHLLLEHLDFTGDIATQTMNLSGTLMPRFNLDVETLAEPLSEWMIEVVDTSLDSNGLSLKSIDNKHRLNEMEFDLSINDVNFNELNRLLDDYFETSLSPVVHETIQGVLTGIIDLVFEFDGKYYIADYKSNYLGGTLSDYSPEQLTHAVFEHRYDLQYLIYTLALHRYLSQRIPDYDYELHMGGVYYLLLRGMRVDQGAKYGVYASKPPLSIIEALDNTVFSVNKHDRESV
ncbi:MAG: exodeoxyribonuclease V subunit beta [Gammaproteobacteria bacterium]|nr:exodeoxyribonuclease V subunit beta [Gammaproteobacteria bacterium]